MKCPHCDQPLPERICRHCQAAVIDAGPFCSYCGSALQEQPEAEAPGAPGGVSETGGATVDQDIDIDWENRVLCSDESCIGVIGPDGRCKVCGKPYAPAGASPE